MVVVIDSGPSDADAVEDAVDNGLWREDIEKRSECNLFTDTVWGDGSMLCEAEM